MNKPKNERLLIIDGNAILHRSFHGLPTTITTKRGDIVNAVYGFASVLIKSLREFKPKYVILTMDMRTPTFRHKIYDQYKATRKKAPDELYEQIPKIKEVAKSFGIPLYEKEGFEADDLIGTISNKVDKNIDCIILTGDMDTLQLVNNNTKVYTMSRGIMDSVLYGEDEVKNRYGFLPPFVVDYKALSGDTSDNIPGIAGIGDKTAKDLLKKYKTLDGIYDFINKNPETKEIKPRILNLLKEYKNDAYMSYELATIDKNVDINIDLEDADLKDFDKEKVVKIFSKLEFKSLIFRLNSLYLVNDYSEHIDKFTRNKKDFNYNLIDSDKDFEQFFKKLKKQKYFTFDTETTSLDPLTANLLGISFSWKKNIAYYLNFSDKDTNKTEKEVDSLFNYNKTSDKEIIMHKWLVKLKPIFENKNIRKRAHNIKYDIRIMKNLDINVNNIEFDTMIASYLLDPGKRQHSLDNLTFREFGFEKINKEDLLGKGKNKISFADVDIEKIACYSCEDADFTEKLAKKLKKELKENDLYKLFTDIEMPLVKVLSEMEENGVKINIDILKQLSIEVSGKLFKLEKKIWKLAGEPFNIRSPLQLKKILFDKLRISTDNISKTKTGYSTASDELKKIENEHEIVLFIEQYREFSKLLNTYINALPKLVNSKTNRVHTSFNQTITATGRLSSTSPNLQNIPTKTDFGQKIRTAFIPENGYKLLGLDYSQIELRIAAHIADDKKMIEAFKNNLDIHTITAAKINNVSTKEVTKSMRREAKAVNFGILYGQGPYGLAEAIGVSFKQAKEFIDSYFKVYKGIKCFIDNQIEKAKKEGFVETLFHRKRYLPEINSKMQNIQKGAERMAVNTPIQGSNADIIKIAMIKIHKVINEKYNKKDVKMIIQVHDELIFEVKNDLVEEVMQEFKEIMQNVIKLKVPVIVEHEIGDNWGDLK